MWLNDKIKRKRYHQATFANVESCASQIVFNKLYRVVPCSILPTLFCTDSTSIERIWFKLQRPFNAKGSGLASFDAKDPVWPFEFERNMSGFSHVVLHRFHKHRRDLIHTSAVIWCQGVRFSFIWCKGSGFGHLNWTKTCLVQRITGQPSYSKTRGSTWVKGDLVAES